jgi:hypothetical protein
LSFGFRFDFSIADAGFVKTFASASALGQSRTATAATTFGFLFITIDMDDIVVAIQHFPFRVIIL